MGCRGRGKQCCHVLSPNTLHLKWVMFEFCTRCVLQDFIYPENVAYPIGGPGNPQFLVMEIHYDNPNMRSGMLVRLSS